MTKAHLDEIAPGLHLQVIDGAKRRSVRLIWNPNTHSIVALRVWALVGVIQDAWRASIGHVGGGNGKRR